MNCEQRVGRVHKTKQMSALLIVSFGSAPTRALNVESSYSLLTRRRPHIFSLPSRASKADNMKVIVKHWHAVAQWRWDIGTAEQEDADTDNEGDVCGICRRPLLKGAVHRVKSQGRLPPQCVSIRSAPRRPQSNISHYSLGRMHTRLPHALFTEMDRNGCVEAAVSYGP